MQDILVNPVTQQAPSNEGIQSLSKLVQSQVDLEAAIVKSEEQLEVLKAKHVVLTSTIIPDLMLELGMKSLSLANGAEVEIKPFISAKIPDTSKLLAFKWLRDKDLAGIIKRQISVALGKGDDKLATRIAKGLKKLNVAFEDKESIHPQTLKSFCKEQIELNPTTFPRDLFGVFEGKISKVTLPKSK
jgi:hypothetical protein